MWDRLMKKQERRTTFSLIPGCQMRMAVLWTEASSWVCMDRGDMEGKCPYLKWRRPGISLNEGLKVENQRLRMFCFLLLGMSGGGTVVKRQLTIRSTRIIKGLFLLSQDWRQPECTNHSHGLEQIISFVKISHRHLWKYIGRSTIHLRHFFCRLLQKLTILL